MISPGSIEQEQQLHRTESILEVELHTNSITGEIKMIIEITKQAKVEVVLKEISSRETNTRE